MFPTILNLVSFYCNAIKLHGKKIKWSQNGYICSFEISLKFLSLSTLIFFSASCQFSASVTLKAGILQTGNYHSHSGCDYSETLSESGNKLTFQYWKQHKSEGSTVLCLRAQPCLTLWPHGLQSARLLWGVDCHFLLQGIFPTQELNLQLLGLLHCQTFFTI